jgi:hypothetical protein
MISIGTSGYSYPEWKGTFYPEDFDIETVPDRVARVGDLWADILGAKHDLRRLLESERRRPMRSFIPSGIPSGRGRTHPLAREALAAARTAWPSNPFA